MQDNNINEIITNALKVNKTTLANNVKEVVKKFKNALVDNEKTMKMASSVDIKNNNGFILDFDVINNILSNLEKEKVYYGDVTLSQKDEDKNIMYGTQIMDSGNVVVVTDGNPYVTLEMLIRNIIAGNTTVFVNDGYMYGTNKLLVEIIQSVLEQFNISKYLVQLYITDTYEDILSNYANIDLVICIGDHNLQSLILDKSKNKTIISGYENFDLYIDDDSNIEFINKILDTGLNIQLYVNGDIDIEYSNSIPVGDIEEAIAQINYNGNKYSSSIFTNSTDNATKFLKEVKSEIVAINTSPTVERMFDIKQKDLVLEKKIIYPFNFKLDGIDNRIDL